MPKLKAIRDTLEDLNEKYHDLYQQAEDGSYVLVDVEDKQYKTKLDEFRTNNRVLHNEKAREVSEHEATKRRLDKLSVFEGLDDFSKEKYDLGLEALAKIEADKDKVLLDEGKVEELLAKRTEAMRADYNSTLKVRTSAYEELATERDAVAAERDLLRNELESLTVDRTIESAVSAIGQPRKGAMEDIKQRARKIWQMNDVGKMKPMLDGEVMRGKSGEELDMEEWSQNLLASAPHLFEPGKGGGAPGGGGVDLDLSPRKSIDSTDALAIGKNLADIASGKVDTHQ